MTDKAISPLRRRLIAFYLTGNPKFSTRLRQFNFVFKRNAACRLLRLSRHLLGGLSTLARVFRAG